MDFENNEKKQEETQNEGFQKEYRPGRSPRPRIHTAQRPAYDQQRSSYRPSHDEGGFRPASPTGRRLRHRDYCRYYPID